jgi:cysteine synthase
VIVTATDVPPDSPQQYIQVANRLAKEIPNSFRPDQYNNPENPLAHYLTTGPEIWEQTEGRVTHLVSGIGTSGTLVGTARPLRELNPSLTAVAVQPDSPLHALEGLKHLPSAMTPPIYDPAAHQRTIEVASDVGKGTTFSMRLPLIGTGPSTGGGIGPMGGPHRGETPAAAETDGRNASDGSARP